MSDDDIKDGDEFNEEEAPPARPVAWVLPLLTAIIALLVGVGFGAMGMLGWWRSTPPVEVEVVRELTEAEIEAACRPFVTDTLEVLTEAQAKVVDLEDKVAQREARVAELEAVADQRTAAGKKVWAELQAVKAELETLREQLATAIEEKEAALVELEKTVERLKQTESELEVTQEKLTFAQGDVLDNRWKAFVQDAQLEICERGGRRKMGKCREAVTATFGADYEQKYRHCVKSGQAVPGLQEAPKDMETLPAYSYWLDQENRILKGWFVTLCDPTLPEAEDFDEALKNVRGAEEATDAPLPEGIEDLDADGE